MGQPLCAVYANKKNRTILWTTPNTKSPLAIRQEFLMFEAEKNYTELILYVSCTTEQQRKRNSRRMGNGDLALQRAVLIRCCP